MAKLKKMPPLPKLPKKPKPSASLAVHENWLRRVKDLKSSYQAKVNAVKKFNASVESDKKKKETIRKQIAGISGIAGVKSGSTKRRKSAKVSGTKRKKAAKKVARKSTRRRR